MGLSYEHMSDNAWARVRACLPVASGRGRPWREHRQVIDGIRYVHLTRCSWRELPDEFGPWQTCHSRYARWRRNGLWDQIEAALDELDAGSYLSDSRD